MHMDGTQGSWNLTVGVADLGMLVTCDHTQVGPAGLGTETHPTSSHTSLMLPFHASHFGPQGASV